MEKRKEYGKGKWNDERVEKWKPDGVVCTEFGKRKFKYKIDKNTSVVIRNEGNPNEVPRMSKNRIRFELRKDGKTLETDTRVYGKSSIPWIEDATARDAFQTIKYRWTEYNNMFNKYVYGE